MNIQDDIFSAIRTKSKVEIMVLGEPSARKIEPHIGYEASNGEILMDFYQTAGFSESDGLPDWRRKGLDEIASVRISEEKYEPRRAEGYNPQNQKRYTRIICMVS